jgi:hypothetical protein
MKDINPQLQTFIKWLLEEAENITFGEIGITLVIHGGSIKRVDQTLSRKTGGEQLWKN